jgi:hypothetical protein
MSCSICSPAENSYNGKPFCPPTGSVNDRTFTCSCGQRWWQYNDYYHLWSMVDDDETFSNILDGCPRPVAIGNPSKNA